jgi:GMP synthase-like glutamine amidotransferase
MKSIAIVETSEGLGEYFTKGLVPDDYEIFPVWSTRQFPNADFDSYILTGDYNNISNGLLPIHEQEIIFLDSIMDKKIFCSCFSHQLMAKIHGGMVCKREERFLGWYRLDILAEHPIFNGIDKMYFLCLNVDEIRAKPKSAKVLATNPDCKYQVLQYGENILTFQSHPEIYFQEGLEAIKKHREDLLDHCAELDLLVERTEGFADDDVNEIFMRNLVEWLRS